MPDSPVASSVAGPISSGLSKVSSRPKPILLRELGHFGDQRDILLHVGRQFPRLVLAGPVLAEEMVEGDDQRALAGLLGPLADGPQTVFHRVKRDGQIDLRIRIGGDRLQFLVTDQDDGALASEKLQGPGKATSSPW